MDANEPERSRGRLKYKHNLTVITSESPDLKKKALLMSLLTSEDETMTKSCGHCFKVILVSPQRFLYNNAVPPFVTSVTCLL